MKKFVYVLMMLISILSYTHPGGLDKNGGHYNKKTGEYHYHKTKKATQNETKEEIIGRILYVPDGDTIHIEVDGEKKRKDSREGLFKRSLS